MRKKTKNKRFERKHVLKVKIRTSQRRQLQLRNTVWSLALTGLLGFSIYIAWRGGEAFLRWAFTENPYFEIHQLAIENHGVIRQDQLAQWAGVRHGLNMFSLDLNRVKRDLEVLPVIASAEIERILPNTIKIRIKEREPVARYALPEFNETGFSHLGLYTLDKAGFFMAPLKPHQCITPQESLLENLPFLTGIPRHEVRPGYQAESPQVRSALNLIESFSRSPMAGLVDIKRIHLGVPGVLEVQTGQGTVVIFSLTDFERQIHRWRAIHDYGRRLGKHLASLDLSVSNNVPLVWQETGSQASPPNPNPINSTRTPKKNV